MAAVALVVLNPASLSAGDTDLQSLLTGLGHTVTLVDDAAAVSAGKDLHVISDSCSSGAIGTKYETVATPVVCCDVDCPDQLKMCSGSNDNTVGSGTTWTIISHAITAGLTPGEVTMKTGGNSGRWGWLTSTLGAGAQVFATRPGAAVQVLGMAYEAGSTATTGTMPARRVYLSFLEAYAANLNVNGELVFTQAVAWALDTGGGVVALDGSASATADLDGSVAVSRPYTAKSTTVGNLDGAASVSRPVTGQASAAGSASGALTVTRSLTGTTPASADLDGEITRTAGLAASAPSTAASVGDLTVGSDPPGERHLAGAARAMCSASGSLSVLRRVDAATAAAVAADGAMAALRAITADTPAVSNGSGVLARAVPLDGSVAAVVMASGALSSTADIVVDISVTIGPTRIGTAAVGVTRIGTALVEATTRVGTAEIDATRVGTAEVAATRSGTADVGATRVGTADIGETRLGTADIGETRLERGE